MNIIYSIVVIILFGAGIIVFLTWFDWYRLLKSIRSDWGNQPYRYQQDNEKSLRHMLHEYQTYSKHDGQVDDVTQSDLDLFELYQRLNVTGSSIGSEKICILLREFDFNEKTNNQIAAIEAVL